MARSEDAALLHELAAFLDATGRPPLTAAQRELMLRGLYCLKDRAKTFPELIEKAAFILSDRPIVPDEAAARLLDPVSRGILKSLTPQLQNVTWTRQVLETVLPEQATLHGLSFGKLAGPLRAALAGRTVTPGVTDMMLVIGRDETIARLRDASA
jgi:glutamyl-tRNA synthetase